MGKKPVTSHILSKLASCSDSTKKYLHKYHWFLGRQEKKSYTINWFMEWISRQLNWGMFIPSCSLLAQGEAAQLQAENRTCKSHFCPRLFGGREQLWTAIVGSFLTRNDAVLNPVPLHGQQVPNPQPNSPGAVPDSAVVSGQNQFLHLQLPVLKESNKESEVPVSHRDHQDKPLLIKRQHLKPSTLIL